jgi:membrane protease YdiL (CAAX protease family)
MSDAPANRRRGVPWILVAIVMPIVAVALVLVATYVEEAVFRTTMIESFLNKTPLGPPLRRIAQTIVELFPVLGH